jgi:hypothetical protein
MAGFYIVTKHDKERVLTLRRVADNTGSAVYLDDAAEAALPAPTGTMPGADVVTYAAAVKDLSVYTIPYDDAKGPLFIKTQPVATQTVAEGDDATFTVVAGGAGAKTYQWYYEGILIDSGVNASAATASLVNSAVTPESAGAYWCVVSTVGNQSVTSAHSVLTVTPTP